MCIVYAYYAVESSLERWPLQAVFCGSTKVKEGRYCGMRSCNIDAETGKQDASQKTYGTYVVIRQRLVHALY